MLISPNALIKWIGRKVTANPIVGPLIRQWRRKYASITTPVTIQARGALVALRVSGGIGDYLVAARFVRDLLATVGNFYFDLYGSHKTAISIAFADHPFLNKIYEEDAFVTEAVWKSYPLAIRLSHFPVVYSDYMDRDIISLANPKLMAICSNIDKFIRDNDFAVFIRSNSNLDGALSTKAYFRGCSRSNLSHHISNIPYGGDRLFVPRDEGALPRFLLTDQKYVTIHNGFDEFFSGATSGTHVTKIYQRFDEVVAGLKKVLGDHIIVQVGGKTSTPIAEVDVNLINRTTLAEAAEILGNAALHIDNESGLVHLAACLGVPACVLFGPTPVGYFGYESNINISPTVCGGCWWATTDWMIRCPRGFEQPICLSQTPPNLVVDEITRFLRKSQ